MGRTPKSDIDVTVDDVRRLLAATEGAYQGLADTEISEFASGWDNYMFRAGSDHLVRLPRRQVAVELLRNEQRWLPELADNVSRFAASGSGARVGLPVPLFRGVPTDLFPRPWSILPWFSGETAAAVIERGAATAPLANPLAAALTGLHQPGSATAPKNPFRGGPLAARTARTLATLNELAEAEVIDEADRKRACEAWESAADQPPWPGAPVWIHGDLHPLNIIVAGAPGPPTVRALIDFGDLTAGDPATDLAAAWWLFGRPGRERFRLALTAYGHPAADDASWGRGRGWALSVGAAVLANSGDNPLFFRLAQQTLLAAAGGYD